MVHGRLLFMSAASAKGVTKAEISVGSRLRTHHAAVSKENPVCGQSCLEIAVCF